MNAHDEQRFRRLSPLTPVARAPIVLLAVVGTSWQQLISQGVGVFSIMLGALLVAGGAYGVASWVRTKYWIDGDELRIDTGVVVRQSRRIRIDRLQGIDIVQPLVARLMGLAELKFDLASGGDREGSLAFLPHREALELRSSLLDRRDDLRDGPSEGAASAGGTPPRAPAPEVRLATLQLGPLVGSLLLSTEALLMLVSGVALVVTFLFTGAFLLAGGLAPALIGLALALARKLTSYYGFTLSDSAAGLHVRRGLTSLSSQTIARARIQGLLVTEPLLWRPFGWAKLDVSVAGYKTSDPDLVQASSTLMPVAPRAEIHALVHRVLGRGVSGVPLTAPPRRARWVAPLTAWTMAVGQDAELVVSRRGFWHRRVDIVPQARVQSVRLAQGPLQRRLRLADVHVDSPPGPVRLLAEARDEVEARALLEHTVTLGHAARQRPPQPSAGRGSWEPPEMTQ
ncbi:MAG TPA: PH domain-containing protein [Marmoricola sp.]|nr:PH domain-containing protein [Marmoricola sp.]